MEYFAFNIKEYIPQIITSIIVILFFLFTRIIIIKLVVKFTHSKDILSNRTTLIIKYINFIIGFFLILTLTAIWGLDSKDISSFFISITAFVGVAFFAQWSVLSNVTGGIVLFFSYPFKIGDVIKIQDKDFPITARIEDIKAFYIILNTLEGDIITYPNNMMLQKGIILITDPKIIESIPKHNI